MFTKAHLAQNCRSGSASLYNSTRSELQNLELFTYYAGYSRSYCGRKFRCAGKVVAKPKVIHRSCSVLPEITSLYEYKAKPSDNDLGGRGLKRDGVNCIISNPSDQECKTYDGKFVANTLCNTLNETSAARLKTTGIERCLHPSAFRLLNTVTSLEFTDHFKLKNAETLGFYRTGLAVNHRRPLDCIQFSPNSEENSTIRGWSPINVCARLLQYNVIPKN